MGAATGTLPGMIARKKIAVVRTLPSSEPCRDPGAPDKLPTPSTPDVHSHARRTRPSMNIDLGDVSHTIQLAIAPVFLLTGVGTNLMVLTNRLARIIDRTRVLEDRLETGIVSDNARLRAELLSLYQRTHLINRAITLSTTCALLVCITIAALFVGDALALGLSKFIALLFIFAMLALIGSFVYLLREIFVAIGSISIQGVLIQK
jgi:hypothetical protein